MDFFSCLSDELRNELLLVDGAEEYIVFSDEEFEKIVKGIRKCDKCRKFTDAWVFTDFCIKCQELLVGEIE